MNVYELARIDKDRNGDPRRQTWLLVSEAHLAGAIALALTILPSGAVEVLKVH